MFISYSITPSAVCVNRVCFYIDTLSTFKFNMQLFKFSHLLFRYYFSSFKQLKFYSLELKFYPQNSKRNSNFDILFEFLFVFRTFKRKTDISDFSNPIRPPSHKTSNSIFQSQSFLFVICMFSSIQISSDLFDFLRSQFVEQKWYT